MTEPYFQTTYGCAYLGDSSQIMAEIVADASVDLIITSPPFALIHKKDYGNKDAVHYVEWFKPFGQQIHRILRDSGSFVIDISGVWIPGQPTRSLYHYELLLMLCKDLGFHLAQEFFWWNPATLPGPAIWTNIRRVRVKDAVNCVWWLSKTPWPKASNLRVMVPYSDSMKSWIESPRQPSRSRKPSGHTISKNFSINNGGAITSNLIAIANTESNSNYQRLCRESGVKPHPARFPHQLPEFFIRMLTDVGDVVIDPFAGSCVTSAVAERLRRRWICIDNVEDYLRGARFRFEKESSVDSKRIGVDYRIPRPDANWNMETPETLPSNGGNQRTNTKQGSL